ncbi:MAG: PEP-CTERM sorting domain-containing protein, partial [Abditibacteriota bacterium]|nr:PEP-CTERM sorting domain-containing protein [Abditibacteriota bacterium]
FGTGDAVDEIYIVLGHAYSSGTYSFANTTPNTYGSARFMMGRPETEVPEPGTIAYALMGLGSLAGIKRRIKK